MYKIFFIDTLTTGMNVEKCSIYRIGGIYTENGIEKFRFEFRMRPFINARINEQSIWISGESRQSLTGYESESDAFGHFIEMLDSVIELRNPKDKAYIAGFNAAAFDMLFLREWFRRNGNERFRDYFHVQVIDTMSLSAFALLPTRADMPDFHLNNTARFLGIDVYPGAGYNCTDNAKLSLDIFRHLQTRFGLSECMDETESTEFRKNF